MSKTANMQELLDRQLELIGQGRLDEVENLWLDLLPDLPIAAEFLKPWLAAIRKANALDRAEALVAMLIEDRLDRDRPKEALRALLLVLPAFPESAALRPSLLRALRVQHAALGGLLGDFIRLSGLEKEGSLLNAYKAFREWTRLAPGQVYQHYDWGEGVVEELDLAAGKLTLAFPKDPRKVMTIDGARKFLTWIEPKHFLARRAKELEALQVMADQQPVELVKLALAGQPDMQIRQADLKALLIGTVVDEKQWTSWWGRAREAMAVDPYVDFDRAGGARAMIALRQRPRTFAQEIADGFFDPEAGAAVRVELIRQLAKKPKDANLPRELVERMAKRLREEWDLAAADGPVALLEAAFMLQDLAQAVPSVAIDAPDPEPILAQIDNYRVLFDMDHPDYAARALVVLMRRDGEPGFEQAAELLPDAPIKMAQAIWETMGAEHHGTLGARALQRLFDNPLDNPETFAWALKSTLDGSWKHMEDDFPAQAMIPELIDQMEDWQAIAEDASHPRERRDAARKLLSRGRTLLAADHFELLCLAVEDMQRDMINRLRRRIQTHAALNAAVKAQADRAITLTRRDLEEAAEGAATGGGGASDGVFLCTPRAQAKAMAELREIASVLIPKNAKVIGEARAEGDLSENAGYHYAKEEQKMLVQKQATLSDLLSRARVVRAEDVDAGRVGFGTRFTVRNEQSGEAETYVLLGRWEADAEHNVLSEQAPLARQFAGRKVGERLRVQRPGAPSTDYEILAIENALVAGPWDSAEA
jgi:transcription elongation GreA/GreB family factor